MRFERGVDPAGQARAIERATELLAALAGGEPGPLVVTEDAAALPQRAPVELRRRRLDGVLGFAPDDAEVEAIFGRLAMRVERTDGGWRVTPPSFRFDIGIEEDLIEEIGRIAGYDRIPVTPAVVTQELATATEHRVPPERYVDRLAARGWHEVITYGFVDERLDRLFVADGAPVPVANPIAADLNVLRRSLWPGLAN